MYVLEKPKVGKNERRLKEGQEKLSWHSLAFN